jgi:hypothetical protein
MAENPEILQVEAGARRLADLEVRRRGDEASAKIPRHKNGTKRHKIQGDFDPVCSRHETGILRREKKACVK